MIAPSGVRFFSFLVLGLRLAPLSNHLRLFTPLLHAFLLLLSLKFHLLLLNFAFGGLASFYSCSLLFLLFLLFFHSILLLHVHFFLVSLFSFGSCLSLLFAFSGFGLVLDRHLLLCLLTFFLAEDRSCFVQ